MSVENSLGKTHFRTFFAQILPLLPQQNQARIRDHILETASYFPGAFFSAPPLQTALRLCHFLSQCAHESGNFQHTEENLRYSAQDLERRFSKYFPDADMRHRYAHQPEKIGSRIYANRMGNGNEASKEGYIFRGRGYLQLTGKNNYTLFSGAIAQNCVAHPEWVAAQYAMVSAVFFFEKNTLWVLCDKGEDPWVVREITRVINGGLNGLAQRVFLFQRFFSALKHHLCPP